MNERGADFSEGLVRCYPNNQILSVTRSLARKDFVETKLKLLLPTILDESYWFNRFQLKFSRSSSLALAHWVLKMLTTTTTATSAPMITGTVDNSNFLLTRTKFVLRSSHFLTDLLQKTRTSNVFPLSFYCYLKSTGKNVQSKIELNSFSFKSFLELIYSRYSNFRYFELPIT